MGYYIILPSANNQFYWNLKADNHEIILTSSEQYVTKAGANASINSSKVCINSNNFKASQANNGQYYFLQIANNHLTLGKSETYFTPQGYQNGISSVIQNAPNARIIDATI